MKRHTPKSTLGYATTFLTLCLSTVLLFGGLVLTLLIGRKLDLDACYNQTVCSGSAVAGDYYLILPAIYLVAVAVAYYAAKLRFSAPTVTTSGSAAKSSAKKRSRTAKK